MFKTSNLPVLIALCALLLATGVIVGLYMNSFYKPHLSSNFNDWTSFSNYFNGLISPVIAFLNLVLFVVITYRVSALQGNLTVNQMRNDAYQSLITSYNAFCTEYGSGDSGKSKLYVISAFISQISLYPDKMGHLFKFAADDQDISKLKTSLDGLKIKARAFIADGSTEKETAEYSQYEVCVAEAGAFLSKVQKLILDNAIN